MKSKNNLQTSTRMLPGRNELFLRLFGRAKNEFTKWHAYLFPYQLILAALFYFLSFIATEIWSALSA